MASRQQQQQQEVPLFHTVFVEHAARYEFIAHPIEMSSERINYMLYRSSSSLSSLNKFKSNYGNGTVYIKFGWHDLTKPYKFLMCFPTMLLLIR